MADPVSSFLVDKAVESAYSKAKQEIGYVWNCTKNVEESRDEAQKLKEMRGRIQQRIDVANRSGEALLDGVQKWMDKAGAEISDVEEFLREEAGAKKTCFNLRLCVSLGTLRHYSKMAAIEKTPVLLKQQLEGKTFEENSVSVPTPTPRSVVLYQTKNLDDIDTHKLVLAGSIEALRDESIQMVGIYGSGGVGKTTLAKEVAAQLKKLFAEIVFITVSQTVDIEKIQKDVENGAKRIMNGEKILIILDDIWESLALSDLGIPCGKDHMNCKILLTSRRMNVCEGMNVDRKISVNTLTDEEAWVLFKRMVGERLEKEVRLEKIAKEVTEECGGLPLIIQAVGNALKNKPIHIWEAALDRLQKHAPLEIAPEIRKAFTHLKLSYDLLESKEAQSCFLLCSMFSEDEYIDLERLVGYGMGLGIFDNLDSINDARKRVQIAVDTLTSSGLLLTDDSTLNFKIMHKMHDVVRDVALLITSPSSSSGQGEEKFLVKAGTGLTEWQPKNRTSDMSSYTKISLMDNHIEELPADRQLHFPLLDTFLIPSNRLSVIPDDFFGGMKEVKVLDMSWNNITALPQSLKLLTKLITLDLSYNISLEEISVVGELKELEILKVRWTGIKVIPEEIGELTNLRLLDASACEYLSHVTRGVISKLTWLEGLYIGTIHSHAVSDFVLMEIRNLKSLTTLHLTMPLNDDCDLFPEGTDFEKLPEFFFQFNYKMGRIWERLESDLKRQLQIASSNFPFTMPIKKIFQVSDGIQLSSIKDLDNIIPDLYGESCIDQLKCIQLLGCKDVSCLVKTRDDEASQATQTFVTSTYDLIGQRETTKDKCFSQVEEIALRQLPNLKLLFDYPFQYISLRNLQDFEILECSSLLTLFPLSVAQGLSNLRSILISECDSLAVVISTRDEQTEDGETEVGVHDDKDDAIIVLPSLTHIYLRNLPKLKSFYSGDSTVKYPSLKVIRVIDCPSMQKWGYGVHDIPNLESCDEETLNLFHS